MKIIHVLLYSILDSLVYICLVCENENSDISKTVPEKETCMDTNMQRGVICMQLGIIHHTVQSFTHTVYTTWKSIFADGRQTSPWFVFFVDGYLTLRAISVYENKYPKLTKMLFLLVLSACLDIQDSPSCWWVCICVFGCTCTCICIWTQRKK